MIVFLDESYEKIDEGSFRHVYAGFGIGEKEYRSLMAAVHQCKLYYFVQDRGMTDQERADLRRTRIVTALPPELAEIKATKLLTDKHARHHQTYGNAPGLLMVEDLLESLSDAKAVIFAVLSEIDSVDDVQASATRLPLHYIRLLERIELWMREQHPDAAAIIVPDTVHDGIDRRLFQHMADYLFKSVAGKRMRHIVANPFWVDSQATTGSQLADVVAHVLLNNARPRVRQKPLDSLSRKLLEMEYRSLNLQTRGIRRIKRKQQA